ncbi:vanin-like protein 2 [Diprion similis]|uniref:vanin-like protein 2 n=1 Tax=Diprion similis TaxID=362088 RepID=UPI001EF8FA1C|nr:vanin-like protein 2 [Diprion similis]
MQRGKAAMMGIFMHPLLLLLLTVQVQSSQDKLYNAATFEYEPKYIENNPSETMKENAKEYEKQIELVSKDKAQIIVFPELGLTSIHLPSRPALSNWSMKVPDPKENIVPCDESSSNVHEVLRNISCAAKTHKLYVVINLVEKEDEYLYSSNVVFSSEGKIVSRYRKYYRFNEFGEFNQSKELIATAFNTSFGTFGVLIGADILYEEPARTLLEKGVKDFVYPVAWVSVLPFSRNYQMQLAWSKAKKVNVISAPYYPGSKYAGGIFLGETDDGPHLSESGKASSSFVQGEKRISINDINESVVAPSAKNCVIKNNGIGRKFINMSHFKSKQINSDNDTWTEEHGDVKCAFEVNADFSAAKTDLYYFFVYNGKYNVFGEKCCSFGTSVCAIVKCNSKSLLRCGQVGLSLVPFKTIKIKAIYNQREHELNFQSTLHDGYSEIPAQMNSTKLPMGKMQQTMVLSSETPGLVAFGIVRKFFEKFDPDSNSNDNANNYKMSTTDRVNNPDDICTTELTNNELVFSPTSIYPYVLSFIAIILLAGTCVAIKSRRQILTRIAIKCNS